jgi:hypothetical protein
MFRKFFVKSCRASAQMMKITRAFPHVYSPPVTTRKAFPKSALNILIPHAPSSVVGKKVERQKERYNKII